MREGYEQAGEFYLCVILLSVHAVSAQTCDELQCLNSNPCQTFRTRDNISQARCICGGKWAGHRCQHFIHVQPESVTASQVRLKVELMTSANTDVTRTSRGSLSVMFLMSSKEKEEEKLNYTLVYWRRNDTLSSLTFDSSLVTSGQVSCVMLHKKNARAPVLDGLSPRTRYTICIENGFIESCVLSSFAYSPSLPSASADDDTSALTDTLPPWPSNCVTIFTPDLTALPAVITKGSTVTIVAVISVFILLALVLIFIAFLIRRQSAPVGLFLDGVCHRCFCCSPCCRGRSSSGENSQDSTYFKQASASHSSRTIFLGEDQPGEARARSLRKSILEGLRPGRRKKPKEPSHSTASANMLLPPPLDSFTGASCVSESSPLDSPLSEDSAQSEALESDMPAHGNESAALATESLPAFRKGSNKSRHRLSRKRRGYVAYSTTRDKNIKLTTVLETPQDDDAYVTGLMGDAESSLQS